MSIRLSISINIIIRLTHLALNYLLSLYLLINC